MHGIRAARKQGKKRTITDASFAARGAGRARCRRAELAHSLCPVRTAPPRYLADRSRWGIERNAERLGLIRAKQGTVTSIHDDRRSGMVSTQIRRITLQSIGRSERGSGLVELAFAVPLMLGLLFAAADFCRVFYEGLAVSQAAVAGVQYGAQSVAASFDITGMQNAAAAAASDIPGFSGNATRSCTCWNPSTETEAINGTCGTCPTASALRVYVTVAGSRTFRTIVRFPGIPDTVVISRSATRRAQ